MRSQNGCKEKTPLNIAGVFLHTVLTFGICGCKIYAGGETMKGYIFLFILWIAVLLVALVSLVMSVSYMFKTYDALIVGVAVSLYIAVRAGEKIAALLRGKPED